MESLEPIFYSSNQSTNPLKDQNHVTSGTRKHTDCDYGGAQKSTPEH